jgi:hypothetical protein
VRARGSSNQPRTSDNPTLPAPADQLPHLTFRQTYLILLPFPFTYLLLLRIPASILSIVNLVFSFNFVRGPFYDVWLGSLLERKVALGRVFIKLNLFYRFRGVLVEAERNRADARSLQFTSRSAPLDTFHQLHTYNTTRANLCKLYTYPELSSRHTLHLELIRSISFLRQLI